ncbi:protein KRI1 homolog isoform X1 [Saccoglossus kowalevskii]|uniref:Protein KRI1 homolog n=1 Tax=Saccoglossus kowalevskii TaxID=10224 RepID=A0ABM0MHM1_SACKO|nr:PREDICTED: protein KRI1 homolog [Saccoglossus kowalevskii]
MEEELTINTSYAKKYNQWRRKEELQKLKARYGDVNLSDEESSSSSEFEDEDAVALTPQVEKDFFRALSAVKFKDPKIYEKDVKFYHSGEDGNNLSADDDKQKVKKKTKSTDKPFLLRDYERKVMLEKGGKFEDEDDSEDEEDEEMNARCASPSYMEEQQILKDSFKGTLDNSESEEDEILTKRVKSKEELVQDEKDYIQWLKGQKEDVGQNKDLSQMVALKEFWTDPKLDEGEKFLRDYILNKGYKDKDAERIPTYGEIVGEDEEDTDYSEEERQLEKEEEFERKFNFRFQEPDSDFIKRYPRTVGESVRTKDNKRASKRSERKDRKLQEKEKKKEELKQLKNIKKKEILEKIDRIKEVTGNKNVAFHDGDLEGDFDPQEHDKMMQNLLGDDYYSGEEDDTKPEFYDEDPVEENWDDWTGEDGEYHDGDDYYVDNNLHCEDLGFVMDADYDPSQDKKKTKKKIMNEMVAISRKKKRQSKFAEALERKKPVFDPEEKNFGEYFDEYYKLDYEDVIGDLPCRFKYRNVIANDFGLSMNEILGAEDKELNQWCSLKKTCQYRPEDDEWNDVKFYKKKGRNLMKKKRVLRTVYNEATEEKKELKSIDKLTKKRTTQEPQETNTDADHQRKKQKLDIKKRENKSDKQRQDVSDSKDTKEFLVSKSNPKSLTESKQYTKMKKILKSKQKILKVKKQHTDNTKLSIVGHRRRQRNNRRSSYQVMISDQRLRAYGINPKRIKFENIEKQKQKNKSGMKKKLKSE